MLVLFVQQIVYLIEKSDQNTFLDAARISYHPNSDRFRSVSRLL